MMYRTIVGVLVVVGACVQAIDCDEYSTKKVDALAQKLEQHFRGENEDATITFAECKGALDEFLSWSDEFRDGKLDEEPNKSAVNFLNDFMHLHLKQDPMLVEEYQEDEVSANKFIKDLEELYKRFRPTYSFKNSLRDSAIGELSESTLAVVDSLLGEGKPLNSELVLEAVEEMEYLTLRLFKITEDENIYDRLDEVELLNKYWLTPEALALNEAIFPLVSDESLEALDAGNQAVAAEWSRVFKESLVKHGGKLDH